MPIQKKTDKLISLYYNHDDSNSKGRHKILGQMVERISKTEADLNFLFKRAILTCQRNKAN
jgi:hypothetical protein